MKFKRFKTPLILGVIFSFLLVGYASQSFSLPFKKGLKVNLEEKEVIYLVAMPKSASTYLFVSLAKVLDGEPCFFHQCGNNQQRINAEALRKWKKHLDKAGKKYGVSSSHVLPDESQIAFFKENNIRVVLLTRKLPDVVVSLRDYMLKSPNHRLEWLLEVPYDEYVNMTKEEQYDLVIAQYLPWYIHFYQGWMKALHNKRDPMTNMYHLKYEEIAANSAQAIESVLTHFDIPYDHKRVLKISKAERNPRNLLHRGVVGRGEEELTPQQMEAIRNLIRPILPYDYVNESDLI